MDESACMSGINLFLQSSPYIHYDKTEGLEAEELQHHFSFLLSGKPHVEGFDVLEAYSSFSHVELAKVEVNIMDTKKIDIPFPVLKTQKDIYVHQRKDHY